VLVGRGTGQLAVTNGQHATLTVTLSAACTTGACGVSQPCVIDTDCGSNSCDPGSLACVGPPAAAKSTLTAPATVVSGASVQVALQAKDDAGNLITRGGATVVFSAQAGTGSATVSNTTDIGNGTYAATVTGVLAGAVTLQATLNGAAVTATAPLAISASTVASVATSTLTAPANVVSGAAVQAVVRARWSPRPR
jgi:hypothetical protein